MALYEEAALKLNTLNDEQIRFLVETWNNKSNWVVHLKGAAGTGKTFVALHCTLEHLGVNTSRQQFNKEKVLLVCPTIALCCFFTRWLLARVEQNDYEREKLLGSITFLTLNKEQRKCKAFQIEINSQDDLDVVDKNIDRLDYAAFGLIIVDESQAIFHSDSIAKLPSSFRDAINTHNNNRKVLLLSDILQAACTEDEIDLPRTLDDTFELRTVSRCSENITAATLPYQLGKRSKCNHGIKGPQVKVDLFGSDNETYQVRNHISSKIFCEYASRVKKAIANIKERFNKGGVNLHKCIAVTVPDESFRERLLKTGLFEKARMKPVRALYAMMKSGIGSSVEQPLIIVDTPPKLNGLEFPFVMVVGLDSPIKDDDPRGNKIVQSCIYRGTSRAYCMTYLINHFIKDGWFEWLLSVVSPNIRENISLPSAENHVPPLTSQNTAPNENAKSSFDLMGEAVNREAVMQLVDTSNIQSKKGNQIPQLSHSKFWYGDTFDISVSNIRINFDRVKFVPTKTRTDWWSLQYASDNLKTNKSYVLAAVQKDGHNLQYASPALRANEAIVKAAVQKNGRALEYASPVLRANEAIVKAAVERDGRALAYASPTFQANEAIVKAAVEQNGLALEYASPALQANEAIVKAAGQNLRKKPYLKFYVSDELKSNKVLTNAAGGWDRLISNL